MAPAARHTAAAAHAPLTSGLPSSQNGTKSFLLMLTLSVFFLFRFLTGIVTIVLNPSKAIFNLCLGELHAEREREGEREGGRMPLARALSADRRSGARHAPCAAPAVPRRAEGVIPYTLPRSPLHTS